MKQKKLLVAIVIVLIVLSAGLVACSKNTKKATGVKITYVLEGGIYRESSNPISHYYDFADGTENLIVDPSVVAKRGDDGDPITRAGYVLEGWYRTKTEGEDGTVYSDKWDFATDKVTTDGVTLYAHWVKPVEFTYNVCYIDEATGVKKVLGSYIVGEGDKFSDFKEYAENRTGYTWVACKDKDGNPWDENFAHPGGEESLAIDVYFEYVRGMYTKVSTAEGLIAAVSENKNVMLTADIDMNGKTLAFPVSYAKKFYGGGHTISNFVAKANVSKSDLTSFNEESNCSLNGIFGRLNGAQITDVTFKDVTLEINAILSQIQYVYVAPLAVDAKDAVLKNVVVENMAIKLTGISENLDESDVSVCTTEIVANKDDKSEISGCEVRNVTFVNATK